MKKIILAFMALAGLCACSSDDVLLSSSDDIATAEKDAVYFKFDLSFANVTRSETDTQDGSEYGTSSSGQEYGQDSENTVTSLTVALVDPETSATIATEYVPYPEKIGTDTYVVTFEKKEIASYAGQDVDVYIYCNHEVTEFDKEEVYTLSDEFEPWTENAFYMSNAISHSETLPTTDEMNSHNTVANPIDLGVVRVERSVARFDYKDGAPQAATAPYTYPITWDDAGGLIAQLELSEVALINMSSNFYAFRHMAETDDASELGSEYANLDEITILNTEYNDNWVIDTDASSKINYNGEIGLTSTFTYLWDAPSTWKWAKFSDITTPDDNDTWSSGTELNYHIWRYATENTIPSIEAQKNGISTGVVFKAELVNTTDGDTYKFGGEEGTGRVYVYENNLYVSWKAVAEAAEVEDENYSLRDAYLEVMDVWTDPDQTEYDADVTAAMAKAGFTGYSPDEDGKYYVYYYYWNQHNNNNQDGIMGIMEYAVVRNNVYKLSVTDITGFGHPTPPKGPDDPDYNPTDPDPNPDPDPIDPNDPDETDDVYLKVDVEILPWVVRENDIKF